MNIELVPLQAAHVDALFALKNSEAMLRWMPGPFPLDPVAFRAKTEAQAEAGCTAAYASFVVVVDGVIAGSIGHFYRSADEPCEVGYYVGERWWGRGVATDALRAALARMRALGVTGPVHAGHAAENVASGRVLEKCGFTRIADAPFTLEDGTVVMDTMWALHLR